MKTYFEAFSALALHSINLSCVDGSTRRTGFYSFFFFSFSSLSISWQRRRKMFARFREKEEGGREESNHPKQSKYSSLFRQSEYLKQKIAWVASKSFFLERKLSGKHGNAATFGFVCYVPSMQLGCALECERTPLFLSEFLSYRSLELIISIQESTLKSSRRPIDSRANRK